MVSGRKFEEVSSGLPDLNSFGPYCGLSETESMARMTAAAPSLKRCEAAASISYLGRVSCIRGHL